MIIITLNDDTEKCFNLNNNDREKALYNAWFSMSDEKKYADKRLKITTHKNEVLNLKISEIKDCKHEDCIYYDNPEVKNTNDQKKEEPKPKPNFMDQINAAQKKKEEERIESFLTELRNRNITINLNDPVLMKILENVKKSEGWKIQLYANMYENSRK